MSHFPSRGSCEPLRSTLINELVDLARQKALYAPTLVRSVMPGYLISIIVFTCVTLTSGNERKMFELMRKKRNTCVLKFIEILKTDDKFYSSFQFTIQSYFILRHFLIFNFYKFALCNRMDGLKDSLDKMKLILP